MNPIIEISLCTLAWLIALTSFPKVVKSRAWKNDPIAFRVWVASLFFALTMTFLITPLSKVMNPLTAPNLSRLLAYSSVAMTLHLTASSFLITFPNSQNKFQLRFLKPYLVFTLLALLFVYTFFVSRTPEWVEQAIPATMAEMALKLALFIYATILCTIMAVACYRYLNQERVTVTRFRIIAIILTAVGGGAFFFLKTVLALSFLWPPLGAEWIHMLSLLLMVGTAICWVGAFVHSKVYVHVLVISRGFLCWPIYQDLQYLNEYLETLCPPVGMPMSKPKLWEFVRNSDYHLYRAIVHILDGKTLIADFLADTIPLDRLRARWDDNGYVKATSLNSLLNGIVTTDDYQETIEAYRFASKRLRESTS